MSILYRIYFLFKLGKFRLGRGRGYMNRALIYLQRLEEN